MRSSVCLCVCVCVRTVRACRGKWDAGMATPKHTPNGRGYSSTLNYWTHKNDFWTMISAQDSCSQPITDLWQSNVTHPMGAPAFHLVRNHTHTHTGCFLAP